MSYGQGAALQAAIFGVLAQDADLGAMVDGAIFDMAPEGSPPEIYVSLGAEQARDLSDAQVAGAEHDLEIRVVGRDVGFHRLKEVAARVVDLLAAAPPDLSRGRLVSLKFRKAVARRLADPAVRRVEMRFRARVWDE